tara:strand:- start:13814 stop:14542 length:729 start_codon:yes stop_codon:yes gene_type:complete
MYISLMGLAQAGTGEGALIAHLLGQNKEKCDDKCITKNLEESERAFRKGYAINSRKLKRKKIEASRVRIEPSPSMMELIKLRFGEWGSRFPLEDPIRHPFIERGAVKYNFIKDAVEIYVSEFKVESKEAAISVCESLGARVLPVEEYSYYFQGIVKDADRLQESLTEEGCYSKKSSYKRKKYTVGFAGWSADESKPAYTVILSPKAEEIDSNWRKYRNCGRAFNTFHHENEYDLPPAVCIKD